MDKSINKEQRELLDEAYMSCMLENGFKYENGLLVGKMGGLNHNVTYWLTKEEFINKCKTDTEFSQRWGLKIEERELSSQERMDLYNKSNWNKDIFPSDVSGWDRLLDTYNIPTKLTIVTYNDKKIESYE